MSDKPICPMCDSYKLNFYYSLPIVGICRVCGARIHYGFRNNSPVVLKVISIQDGVILSDKG